MEQKNMLPGLTREAEEQKLQEIIGIAQQNLERARADIRKVNEDLEDLLDVYEAQDKEGLALWNNATARLKENEYDLVRYEKARRKPYFGRIDFKDPNVKGDESYYIGRVGIAKNNSEPVVLDWRAPIASVYYESGLGPCQYTVSSEGTFTIELKRKRTYEIENDHLKDFFDSDVVANDELLTKYLAKNKKAVLGEIIATIQKEQNLIIRRSPKTNIIVQGVAGSGKTTVAMHRISYILYNYKDDFRPEDFYIIGSNRILLNYITSVLPENDKPEVAFAGKSNVGKSSLINALMNRKSYARISATPGKTQTINFYNINDEMYLVDLPGYGYARVSEKEKEQWGRMIERYLHSSKQLKAVFLLIDIRHDPSANDRMMYQWIVEQGYHPIIIATKLDKIKRSQIQKHVKMLKQGLDLVPGTKVIPFSSQTKQGRDEIWDLIETEYLNQSEEA